MLTIKNGLALFKKGLERESNRLDYLQNIQDERMKLYS